MSRRSLCREGWGEGPFGSKQGINGPSSDPAKPSRASRYRIIKWFSDRSALSWPLCAPVVIIGRLKRKKEKEKKRKQKRVRRSISRRGCINAREGSFEEEIQWLQKEKEKKEKHRRKLLKLLKLVRYSESIRREDWPGGRGFNRAGGLISIIELLLVPCASGRSKVAGGNFFEPLTLSADIFPVWKSVEAKKGKRGERRAAAYLHFPRMTF